MAKSILWVLAALLPLTGACSLALNWDGNGLLCSGVQQICIAPFSCNSLNASNQPVCIRDHSLNSNDLCTLDRQCPESQICPNGYNHCVAACDPNDAYRATANCDKSTYCKPFLSRSQYSSAQDHNNAASLVAACVVRESCAVGAACSSDDTPSGGVCTPISVSATACLPSCTLTFLQGVLRSTSCVDAAAFCQPVGTGNNNDYLTCLDALVPTVQQDQACDPVTAPCPPLSGCIHGFCRAYCAPGATTPACTSPQTCCDTLYLASAAQSVGFCSLSCN